MRVEDEYLDVLQNIEFAIVGAFDADHDLLDLDVLDVLDALIRAYTLEEAGRAAGNVRLLGRSRRLFDGVRHVCEWRLGRTPLDPGELGGKAEGPAPTSVEEVLLCLKRLRTSARRWTKEGGRQGYLNFIRSFTPEGEAMDAGEAPEPAGMHRQRSWWRRGQPSAAAGEAPFRETRPSGAHPASTPRRRYWSREVGGTARCPECRAELAPERHSYVMAVRQRGRMETFVVGSDGGYFCDRCPVVVLDHEVFKQVVAATLRSTKGAEFVVLGLVDLAAVPPERRDLPFDDESNPLPLVMFENLEEGSKPPDR